MCGRNQYNIVIILKLNKIFKKNMCIYENTQKSLDGYVPKCAVIISRNVKGIQG